MTLVGPAGYETGLLPSRETRKLLSMIQPEPEKNRGGWNRTRASGQRETVLIPPDHRYPGLYCFLDLGMYGFITRMD